ncbi:MAG: hypothetical protein HQK54_01535, partial [Oligoflexales bacterium]|nr:hypothetical protein [Oligoflexales bacterium]
MKQITFKDSNIKSRLNMLIDEQREFEKKLPHSRKKSRGVFLTESFQILDSIISNLISDDNLTAKKIIEPSCGTGIFLIYLLFGLHKRGITPKLIRNFFSENVYFCDIDANMVSSTERNISNLYYELFNDHIDFAFNSYNCDFTGDLISSKSSSPLKKLIGVFDYVIGNPPFIALYGRHDKKVSEAQRIYYLKHFTQFPRNMENGKLNLSMMFIENSFHLLKPGGCLSFVLD